MAFKLMEQERTDVEMLKETKMLNHVGSGPVDPAPKEKETKSPVEDGKGAGTAQSSTGHPNVIPPIAYLKKELAKEGINIYGNELAEWVEQIKGLSEDQQITVRQKISEMKGMCPGCKCDPCECDEDEDEDSKKK